MKFLKKNKRFALQKSKFNQNGGRRLEPLLELIKIAKTGAKIARAKNNLHDLANHAKNAGSNFFLENRHLKPVLKNGFNSLFLFGRPPAGATLSERVSFLARVDRIELSLSVLETDVLPLNDTLSSN